MFIALGFKFLLIMSEKKLKCYMCILSKCSLAWIINFIVQNKDKKVERDNNEKKKM